MFFGEQPLCWTPRLGRLSQSLNGKSVAERLCQFGDPVLAWAPPSLQRASRLLLLSIQAIAAALPYRRHSLWRIDSPIPCRISPDRNDLAVRYSRALSGIDEDFDGEGRDGV
jgi:hypothetical protein